MGWGTVDQSKVQSCGVGVGKAGIWSPTVLSMVIEMAFCDEKGLQFEEAKLMIDAPTQTAIA